MIRKTKLLMGLAALQDKFSGGHERTNHMKFFFNFLLSGGHGKIFHGQKKLSGEQIMLIFMRNKILPNECCSHKCLKKVNYGNML
jgi:hypothetical protein